MYESPNTTINCRRAPALARLSLRLLAAPRREDGQALVEFALVLPLLLLAIVGIVSFGRAMNYDEQATHLVNEAARYAMVNQVPNGASGTLGQWIRSQAAADSLELGNGT